jgi:hypothetical protein
MDDAFSGFLIFFSPIQSYPLLSTPIQSDFLRVGLAFCAHLRASDVDRQNLPRVDAPQDFLFSEGVTNRN